MSSSSLPPLPFWCNECDMSVSLLPSPSPLPCPHCRRTDSLLPLDSISPLSLTSFFPSHHSPDLPNPTDHSIAAIPTVEVAEADIVCAICKDDIPRGSVARRLPCCHQYHSECIVPWLSLRNSCPLCRSAIPCSVIPCGRRRARGARFRVRMVEEEDGGGVGVGESLREVEGEGEGSRARERRDIWEEEEWSGVMMADVWEDLFA